MTRAFRRLPDPARVARAVLAAARAEDPAADRRDALAPPGEQPSARAIVFGGPLPALRRFLADWPEDEPLAVYLLDQRLENGFLDGLPRRAVTICWTHPLLPVEADSITELASLGSTAGAEPIARAAGYRPPPRRRAVHGRRPTAAGNRHPPFGPVDPQRGLSRVGLARFDLANRTAERQWLPVP